jgi:hypothetical protein
MIQDMIKFFKQETNKIIIIIVLLFLISIGVSTFISNFTINRKINGIINKITLLRENYSTFTSYYGGINLPTSELPGMINSLEKYKDLITQVELQSEGINTRLKINIKSLTALYSEKNNALLKIADEFNTATKLYKTGINKTESVAKLLEIEKYKLSYVDPLSNLDYYKKRIDQLKDITYNLEDKIFRSQAEKKLDNYLKYFSTFHIQTPNSLDRAIAQKESEILN